MTKKSSLKDLSTLAKEHRVNKNWEEYLKVSQEMILTFPKDYVGFLYASIAFLEKSQYKLALEHIEKSYLLNPNNLYVITYYTKILAKLKRLYEAELICCTYIGNYPLDIQPYIQLSSIYLMQHKYTYALSTLYQGYTFTSSQKILSILFNTLIKYNQIKQAKTLLENIIKEDGLDLEKKELTIIKATQNTDTYLKHIYSSLKCDNTFEKRLYLASQLCSTNLSKNNLLNGIDILEELLKKKPFESITNTLINAYIALNRYKKAKELIRTAREQKYSLKKDILIWEAYYDNALHTTEILN